MSTVADFLTRNAAKLSARDKAQIVADIHRAIERGDAGMPMDVVAWRDAARALLAAESPE